MKTYFLTRGLNISQGSRRWLERSLEHLQSLICISDVAVVLERRRDDAPAFRTFVSLAVPGPDIHAEARDYTLEAAWLKVTNALRKQIEQRKNRQRGKMKSSRRLRAPAIGRGGGAISFSA